MYNLNIYIFLFILYELLSEDVPTPTLTTTGGLICTDKINDCAPGLTHQISKDECEQKGCCYEKLIDNPDDLPWCFNGTAVSTTLIISPTIII